MKKYLFLSIFFMGIFHFMVTDVAAQRNAQNPMANPVPDLQQVNKQFAAQGLRFTENKGQVADLNGRLRPDILFTAENEGVNLFLTANGIHYQFTRLHYKKEDALNKNAISAPQINNAPADEPSLVEKIETYRLDVELKGSNPQPIVQMLDEGPDTENFFLPHCPNGIIGVHNYSKIVLKDVYPDIDWVLYTKGGMLEHDFVVGPGGSTSDIKLEYNGEEKMYLDAEGNLHISTPLGNITEKAPYSFETGGKKLATRYLLKGNTLGFDVEAPTPGNLLTIDPGVEWATYYGGSGPDGGYAVATDGDGNIYFGGPTSSASGISSGGHQNTYGGSMDGFLVKFNANGVRQWATYYGGTGEETLHTITIDRSNNIYIAGIAGSSSGIAYNGYQNSSGGSEDGYLVKFNAQGVRQWATYYGGSGGDRAYVLATDASGNVYMTGITGSSSGIASAGHQNVYGGLQDAYLVKFNEQGVRQWATYYGGSGREIGLGLVTDQSGNIYLSGETRSSAGISSGGHQNTYGGGPNDGFLAKFNTEGIRQWATYYGSSGSETVRAAAIDGHDNIYLVGETSSLTEIASNGYQNTNGGGSFDGFLVKFNTEGTRQWATYYGGDGADYGYAVATDPNGNVFMGGGTVSTTAIASNGIQNTLAGGQDAFLAKFNAQGLRQWGTYYGGLADDFGYAATTHTSGNLYLAGYTSSSNGIATGGHQLNLGGSRDAFLLKITDSPPTDTDGDGVPDGNDCAPNDNTKYRTANLYIDKDNDGYDAGQENVCYGASIPAGYKTTTLGADCDDENNAVTVASKWYKDADNDGYSDGAQLTQCTQPANYKLSTELTATTGDCNDANAAIYPNAPELCDGLDNDCNGVGDEGAEVTWYKDADNDGYSDGTALTQCFKPENYKLPANLTATSGDCDDSRNAVYPNAPELCDGLDNDCDTETDEGCVDGTPWYYDYDNDGFGNTDKMVISVTKPRGYVAKNADCRDWDAAFYPGAPELPDGKDNDCDGEVDEGLACLKLWYHDRDGDGFGTTNATYHKWSCVQPNGYVATGGDCMDWEASVYPGAPDLCDALDNDCDGTIDEGADWYEDSDNDGYSNGNMLTQCSQPAGYKLATNLTAASGDCNDGNPDIHPGATELCDGIDNNCNGQTDEGVIITWYKDTDNDGYSNGTTLVQCSQPDGYKPAGSLLATTGDCDDGNATVFPGATELCDGIDNDCDAQTDEGCPVGTFWYFDYDNDGYGNPDKKVQAVARPRGYIATSGDCRDWDPLSYPGATETGDGIDNNCDGLVDEGLDCLKTWYYDGDGDGYGSDAYTRLSCIQHNGYVSSGGDCKNWDANVYPGQGCPPLTGTDGNAIQPKAMVETIMDIQVFPNPARDEITVTLNGFVAGKKLELQMVQADGKVVSGQSITPFTSSQQVRINLSRLSAGYYLLQVRQGVMQQTRKVMIVR